MLPLFVNVYRLKCTQFEDSVNPKIHADLDLEVQLGEFHQRFNITPRDFIECMV